MRALPGTALWLLWKVRSGCLPMSLQWNKIPNSQINYKNSNTQTYLCISYEPWKWWLENRTRQESKYKIDSHAFAPNPWLKPAAAITRFNMTDLLPLQLIGFISVSAVLHFFFSTVQILGCSVNPHAPVLLTRNTTQTWTEIHLDMYTLHKIK